MPLYRMTNTVKHGGRWYYAGSLADLGECAGKALAGKGLAVEIEMSGAPAPPGVSENKEETAGVPDGANQEVPDGFALNPQIPEEEAKAEEEAKVLKKTSSPARKK
ncbi:MAG: hypothetical protein LBL26_14690 [Peptococcaceae bacterium]|jgi:hypothetical protein|nr:hypothetical protein [Peptococcaceae bacterium]